MRNNDKRFTAIINPLINIPGGSKSQGGQIDSDRLLIFPLPFLTSASHPVKPPGNLAGFKPDTYFTAHDSIALSLSSPLDGYELRLKGGVHLFPWTRMASFLSPLTASLAVRHVRFALKDADLFTPCYIVCGTWELINTSPPNPNPPPHLQTKNRVLVTSASARTHTE
jgi:hypothetical protein